MRTELSLAEQVLFTQRLHVLLRAGIPLLTALRMMGRGRYSSVQWNESVQRMSAHLADGVSFSEAVRVAGVTQDPWVRGLLEAGEASGSLTEHVELWHGHAAAVQRARRQLVTMLIYPVLVCGLILLQLVLLFWFILPRLVPLFQQLHYQLPFATRLLLGIYDQLKARGGWYIAGAGIFVAVLYWLAQRPTVRVRLGSVVQRVPVVGSWYVQRQVLQMSRSLGVLLRAGIPLVPALTFTQGVVSAGAYKSLLATMIVMVESGRPLAAAFLESRAQVPPEFSDLLAAGEESGQLSEACMQAARALGEQVQSSEQRMVALAEPLLLLCVAAGVAFIAVAIILPLYGVTQSIKY